MDDVYFTDVCPICGQKLNLKTNMTVHKDYKCINKCYELNKDPVNTHVTIFGERFTVQFSQFDNTERQFVKRNDLELKNKILELITYWKENDRYLMRIITGD